VARAKTRQTLSDKSGERDTLKKEVNAMSQARNTSSSRGFTLVELLVVITIIGILIALLLPAVQAAREAARRMQCSNNLRQMGLAVHNWHDARRAIPPSFLTGGGTSTWAGLILPFMENQSVYDTGDLGEKTVYALWAKSKASRALVQTQISAYYCPTRLGKRLSRNDTQRGGIGPISGACIDYAMNVGDGLVAPWWGDFNSKPMRPCDGFSRSTHISASVYSGKLVGTDPYWLYQGWRSLRTFADIRDGLSNTLMLGEKHITPDHLGNYDYGDGTFFSDDSVANTCRMAGPSYPLAAMPTDPELGDPPFNNGRFGSWHTGGVCQFVMGDGSVQAISPAINSAVLGYLANYDDGHVIPGNAY
jgi:prepilin-type N-terminal cleavage/methylation domain-containing protein